MSRWSANGQGDWGSILGRVLPDSKNGNWGHLALHSPLQGKDQG